MLNSKVTTLPPPPPSLTSGKVALFCILLLTPILAQAEAISYTQQVTGNSNLVWYMGLNDASGSTAKNEGKLNTNQGVATNVTFQQSGVIGTGAYFNGDTSGITLSETSHVWTNNQATVEAWVKASDVSKLVNIFGYRNSGEKGFDNFARTLNTDSSGKVAYYDFNGNEMYVTATSATLPTDEWVYVAGIINGQAARLFVNGQQVAPASTNQGKSLWNSGDLWVIGSKDLKSNYGTLTTFNGTMDELATYNVTQSQSDFLSKYQVATNQVMEKSLMANATVSASSTYNTTTFNVSKIKDGILNDIEGTGSFDFGKGYWIAVNGVTNASITVDLGKSYNIDKIDLQNCRNAGHGDSGTKDFTLYYSNDGTNWTKILNSTLTTAKEATIMPIESFTFDAVNARYVKFEANTYITGGYRAGLTEMWIFEATDYWGLGTDLSKAWVIDGTKKTGAKFTKDNSNTDTVLANHTGTVTLNSDAEFEITGSRILTQSGAVTGTGALTKTGEGTLKLTLAPEYTGSTTIEAGTLELLQGGTLYNLSGDNNNAKAIISSEDLTLYSEADKVTKYIGSIQATGKTITKTGNGTLKIQSSETTPVQADKFIVSAGRLDMKEYFEGTLEVEAGATLSPGNSIGTLAVDGDVTLEKGSTLLMEIFGAEASENDQLLVGNTLTVDDGALIYLTLAESSTLGPNDDFSVTLTANSLDETALKNSIQSYYFKDLQLSDLGSGTWKISGTVDPNAVPEPSTWALLILGVAGLMWLRRKK